MKNNILITIWISILSFQMTAICGAQPVANNDLVGWWILDDSPGKGTVEDYSSYGNNGTVNGEFIRGVGHTGRGHALSIDGSDYVSLGNNGLPTGSSERTVTAWIRLNSKTNQEFVSWGGNNTDGQRFALFYQPGATGLGFECRNTGGGFPFNYDTKWHHIAAVVPSGAASVGDVLFYFDGQPQPLTYVNGTVALDTQNADPVLGAISGAENGGGFRMNGDLADVRIYKRALSAAEISQIYQESFSTE